MGDRTLTDTSMPSGTGGPDMAEKLRGDVSSLGKKMGKQVKGQFKDVKGQFKDMKGAVGKLSLGNKMKGSFFKGASASSVDDVKPGTDIHNNNFTDGSLFDTPPGSAKLQPDTCLLDDSAMTMLSESEPTATDAAPE